MCRATNELGEDATEASLVCRPLPHLQYVFVCFGFLPNTTIVCAVRFQLPGPGRAGDAEQMERVKEAAARHGVRAKLRGDEIYQENTRQPPRFLLKMESFPKVSRRRRQD